MGLPNKTEKPVFAQNIVLRRKAIGWNAMRLAEEAKIPYPTLRDIEAGYNAGREETKAAIAKALGCQVADLYKDDSVLSLPDLASAGSLLSRLGTLEPAHLRVILGLIYDDATYFSGLPDRAQKALAGLLKLL